MYEFATLRPRFTVLIVTITLLVTTTFVTATQAETRPNIVLIMADDMGYECVSANGSKTYRTPHIDALAASGMRFTHGYSQPICTPSRVQIMTGIYNQKNYIKFGRLDPKATTFANLLRDAGYKTCIAGKWQLQGGFDGPKNFGFDRYCLWQLTRRPGRYPNPGLEIDGKAVDYNDGEYGPDIVSDYLCDFIEENTDGPFLAYYPMILPHWPFEPTPDSTDWDPEAKGLGGYGKKKYFPDMVRYTDKMVGKITAKLDELGIRENTLVIFTGDNGTMRGIESQLGDRIVIGGKGTTKDAGTHVPFIACWPNRMRGGQVSDALVDFSDLLPTLCAAAGVTVPDRLPIDGQSFLPVLLGETASVREWTYCWYARNGGPKGQEFARDRRYKLYRTGKFYDVAADPKEKHPLTDLDDEQKAARKALRKVLAKYEGTRAKF